MRFCASLKGLVTMLSGMNNEEQMNDNLSYMADFKPLTDSEQQVIGKVVDVLNSLPTIPCTGCKYCVDGCPQKINIPGVFTSRNRATLYGSLDNAKSEYNWATKDGGKSSDCIQCGHCQEHCPQHLEIIELLKEAAGTLE